MKGFLLVLSLTIVVTILWFGSFGNKFSREEYINEKILDMARPLDATIDSEFLKKLTPAYEH